MILQEITRTKTNIERHDCLISRTINIWRSYSHENHSILIIFILFFRQRKNIHSIGDFHNSCKSFNRWTTPACMFRFYFNMHFVMFTDNENMLLKRCQGNGDWRCQLCKYKSCCLRVLIRIELFFTIHSCIYNPLIRFVWFCLS